ncbi:hypothetical protein N9B76_01430 [Candidatus Thioglobus sp.]|nr:hypothetical protein [Candidatus Thioglobus sp.]
MKKLALLIFFFSSSSAQSMVVFDYLFQQPYSHTFTTCVPPNQCGGSYLQEFQALEQYLQIISGENNISYDLYEYLNQLDIERTSTFNDFAQKYESKEQKLIEKDEAFEKKCEFSTQYLTSESQKCIDYDNFAVLSETEIINKWDELEVALNEEKLTREQVDKIERIGLSIIDTLDDVTINLISMNNSLTLEIETSKNYLDEQNRIAEEEKKAEEVRIKAAERKIAEEKRKAEEKIKAEERRLAEEEQKKIKNRERAQNNPGFRDLTPGLHYDDVMKICSLEKVWDDKNVDSYWHECFGIKNIKFKASYLDNYLDTLTLDMGPVTDDGYYLDVFLKDDLNIYTKMKKSLDDKYELEFEYSERDRQLFNEQEKSSLFHVYAKGQVLLEVKWITKDYSKDLRLYIHYLDKTSAKAFIKTNKPVEVVADDF